MTYQRYEEYADECNRKPRKVLLFRGHHGTCKDPTRQDRVMGEAVFDMMYSLNEVTVKCPKMKPFRECSDDIVRWRDEMLNGVVRRRMEID